MISFVNFLKILLYFRNFCGTAKNIVGVFAFIALL